MTIVRFPLALLITLALAAPAFAGGFVAVPPLEGAAPPLEIRFVRYDGSTNGRMVVEVSNRSKASQRFVADGLYFVPEGDPEKAPQRLGAAGPVVEIAGKRQKVHLEGLTLAPGAKRQLALEVFCIDSHRASPDATTKFRIAAERVPVKLRKQFQAGNQAILKKNKGDVARSKAAIQSHMWETRDADWIELEGERKNEKAAPSKAPRVQQRRRR